MQANAKYGPNGLLTTLKTIENIEFRNIDWYEEKKSPDTLFITLHNKPLDRNPIKVFNLPTIPAVLFYDNKIDRFPVTDAAYNVYESKKIKKNISEGDLD